MIVITKLVTDCPRFVHPGDIFSLKINKEEVIIETITEEKVIDYVASFRFARTDGSCVGFHVMGFFGNSKELPDEMKKAKQLKDLTSKQRENFNRTCGVEPK